MRERVRHLNPATAGCQLALNADKIPGADGSLVDSWPSLPGGLVTPIAAGAARPTLDLDATGGNGHAAVVFDGLNTWMDLGAAGKAIPNARTCIRAALVVIALTGTDSTHNTLHLSQWATAGSASFALRTKQTTALCRQSARRINGDAETVSTGIAVPGTLCVCHGFADYAGVIVTGGGARSGVNGTNAAAVAMPNALAPSQAGDVLAANLGAAGSAGTTNRFAGRLFAAICSAPGVADPLWNRLLHHLGFLYGVRISTS